MTVASLVARHNTKSKNGNTLFIHEPNRRTLEGYTSRNVKVVPVCIDCPTFGEDGTVAPAEHAVRVLRSHAGRQPEERHPGHRRHVQGGDQPDGRRPVPTRGEGALVERADGRPANEDGHPAPQSRTGGPDRRVLADPGGGGDRPGRSAGGRGGEGCGGDERAHGATEPIRPALPASSAQARSSPRHPWSRSIRVDLSAVGSVSSSVSSVRWVFVLVVIGFLLGMRSPLHPHLPGTFPPTMTGSIAEPRSHG